MIMRAMGTTIALCISTSAMTGIALIIALDFVGEDLVLSKLAALTGVTIEEEPVPTPIAKVVEELPALSGAKDITFFDEVPIEGTPLVVSTGTRFATPADLASDIIEEQWCYVLAKAPDGVSRKIELGARQAMESPVYELLQELPLSELSYLKLGTAALEAIAKTHCRFDKPENAGR